MNKIRKYSDFGSEEFWFYTKITTGYQPLAIYFVDGYLFIANNLANGCGLELI